MIYTIYFFVGALMSRGIGYVSAAADSGAGQRPARRETRRTAFGLLAVLILLTVGCGDDESTNFEPLTDTAEQLDASGDADTAAADTTASEVADDGESSAAAAAPFDDAPPPGEAPPAESQAGSPTSSEASPSPGASSSSTAAARSPLPPWSTQAVNVTQMPDAAPVVADLRAGEHERFNRFVIELEGAEVPSYTINYLDEPVRECGSAREVDLTGLASLEVRLEPARGFTEGAEAFDHSEGSYAFDALQEVAVSCDFESIFAVALGTSIRYPFRVFTLSNPSRLVVDMLHTYP